MKYIYIPLVFIGYILYSNKSHNITINNNNYISIVLTLILLFFIINKINLLYYLLGLTVLIIFSNKFRYKLLNDKNIQYIIYQIQKYRNNNNNNQFHNNQQFYNNQQYINEHQFYNNQQYLNEQQYPK